MMTRLLPVILSLPAVARSAKAGEAKDLACVPFAEPGGTGHRG
jgi:hypothetical protein